MKEWNNQFNPFNSMKVLMYREHLEGIANQEFLPPIVADTDPTSKCNYDCIWCNAKEIRKEKHMLSEEHLLKLADFYKEWGVQSTCVSGGGEPLMNPGFNALLERLHKNGIEIGVITNGSLMTDEHIEMIARTCRWCGFSMDAGTSETYARVKGIKDGMVFYKVLENIKKLRSKIDELDSPCDIGYKYLLHPINAGEINLAAVTAYGIGAHDFHLRPVGLDNVVDVEGEIIYNDETRKHIDKQIKSSMKLESKNFHVYGIRHKFDPDMNRKVNFKRCLAPPLLATFGADGNCHMCFDMRGRKDLILCSHVPDPHEILKVWGSEMHKKMMRDINPNDCPRCTFGTYNEIIEQVFIKDNMCRLHI